MSLLLNNFINPLCIIFSDFMFHLNVHSYVFYDFKLFASRMEREINYETVSFGFFSVLLV